MGTSIDLVDKAKAHLDSYQLYHDRIQIRHLILGMHGNGSVWGQYRQLQRELHARSGAHKQHEWNRRQAVAEASINFKASRAWWRSKAKRDLSRVDYEIAQARVVDIDSQIADLERELAEFLAVGDELRADLPENLADPATRDALDRGYWVTKLGNDVKQGVRLGGVMPEGVVKTMLFLPPDMFNDIISQADGGLDPKTIDAVKVVYRALHEPQQKTWLAIGDVEAS